MITRKRIANLTFNYDNGNITATIVTAGQRFEPNHLNGMILKLKSSAHPDYWNFRIESNTADTLYLKNLENTNEWSDTSLTDGQYEIIYHTLTTKSSNIYMFGGKLKTNEVSKELRIYNTTNNTWSNGVSGLDRRYGHCACNLIDNLYIHGGRDNSGNFLQDIDCYNISGNSWSHIHAGTSDTKRAFHTINVHGHDLWIFGGIDSSMHILNSVVICENVDTAPVWTTRTPCNRHRTFHSSIKDTVQPGGYYLYMMGGEDNYGNLHTVIDIYNALTDIWLDPIPCPFKLKNHKSILLNHQIFTFGGLNERNEINTNIYTYNMDTKIWYTNGEDYCGNLVTDLPIKWCNPRAFFDCAKIEYPAGKIYFYGGEDKDNNYLKSLDLFVYGLPYHTAAFTGSKILSMYGKVKADSFGIEESINDNFTDQKGKLNQLEVYEIESKDS